MNARNARGSLTINDIVEATDEMPEFVLESIQDIIDNPAMDIPDTDFVSVGKIKRLQELQSYYGNQYPYLVGLWGALRVAARRTEDRRIAMRDYLEKACSACKQKYEAASRILTGDQVASEEMGERKW